MKIALVAGARPNFVKVAPLYHAFGPAARAGTVERRLVFTGQHQDRLMSAVFCEELDLPAPDHALESGSGGAVAAEMIAAFGAWCRGERPDLVVVVGDVDSTAACAIAAAGEGIAVAHVEAGLRSGDRSMPEEVNRIATDAVAAHLFVTEPAGVENLRREGRAAAGVHLVGNVMIDALHAAVRRLAGSPRPPLADPHTAYAVATLHRPANVDDRAALSGLLQALGAVARDRPVHFPIHPRTRGRIERFGLAGLLARPGIVPHPPLGYLDFLSLWRDAALVLTDSGGLQEETTALGVPCLTLRERTERPITVEVGTNAIAGTTTASVLAAYGAFARGGARPGRVPELWDGRAAGRIVEIILSPP